MPPSSKKSFERETPDLSHVKLISLDVDHTLIDPGIGPWALSKETFGALARLVESQRFFILLNSGREPWMLSSLAKKVGIKSYCAFSGRYALLENTTGVFSDWINPFSLIANDLLSAIGDLTDRSVFSHAELKGQDRCFVFVSPKQLSWPKFLGTYKPAGWFETSDFERCDYHEFCNPSKQNKNSIFRVEVAVSKETNPKLFSSLEESGQIDDELANDLVQDNLPHLVQDGYQWLKNGAGRKRGFWYLRLIRNSAICNKSSVLDFLAKRQDLVAKEILHVGDSSRLIDGDLVAKTQSNYLFATVANADPGAIGGADLVLPSVQENSLVNLVNLLGL